MLSLNKKQINYLIDLINKDLEHYAYLYLDDKIGIAAAESIVYQLKKIREGIK
jgi:hypothetical protein